MNWVTTNIRLPEEDYLELRMEAIRQRRSFADLARGRLIRRKTAKKKNIDKLMAEMDKFAKKMAKQNKGLSLSEALIKMRYEQ